VRRTIQRGVAVTGTMIALVAAIAQQAPAATVITTYSPFDASGVLRHSLRATPAFGGACVTGSFVVPGDTVYRCFSGDLIRDPCYLDQVQSSPDRSVVVCVDSPWAAAAVRLRVTGGLDNASAARPGGPPWALQLASHAHCVWIEGVSGFARGRRITYRCGNGRLLLGSPDRRRQTWQITQIKGPTDAAPRRVAVARAWR